MNLKEIRTKKGLTQEKAAKIFGITRRTYIKYENDLEKAKKINYEFMCQKLSEYGAVSESKGILDVTFIREACKPIFNDYGVEYCYLFGSYAKGTATESSDVDLLVCTSIKGLKFFELVESLRLALNKNVDVLDQNQIKNNYDLVNEILKDGIKIYG